MNANDIVSTIKSLHIANNMLTAVALAYVEDTAAELAPVMAKKNVQIARGGSIPSSKRMFERIYLEPIGVTDQKGTGEFKVVKVWEWQVAGKWGFHPISPKNLMEFCDDLREVVNSL